MADLINREWLLLCMDGCEVAPMTLETKIYIYCAIMAVGILFLAVLFIRDWRKYKNTEEEK